LADDSIERPNITLGCEVRIEIVAEIPRTGTNKVDRPQLKARFA